MADASALEYSILEKYAPTDNKKIEEELHKYITRSRKKIIVLDDDPTGVQTVHDVSVYTDWTEDSIRQGFAEEQKMFYILTNSRGFTVDETTKCHKEIISRVEMI